MKKRTKNRTSGGTECTSRPRDQRAVTSWPSNPINCCGLYTQITPHRDIMVIRAMACVLYENRLLCGFWRVCLRIESDLLLSTVAARIFEEMHEEK